MLITLLGLLKATGLACCRVCFRRSFASLVPMNAKSSATGHASPFAGGSRQKTKNGHPPLAGRVHQHVLTLGSWRPRLAPDIEASIRKALAAPWAGRCAQDCRAVWRQRFHGAAHQRRNVSDTTRTRTAPTAGGYRTATRGRDAGRCRAFLCRRPPIAFGRAPRRYQRFSPVGALALALLLSCGVAASAIASARALAKQL